MDSTVIQATIGAVGAVIVALIGAWAALHQRRPRPNSKPIKRPIGNHYNPPLDASHLTKSGLSSYNQGQYRSALNYFQQALVIRREVGDRAGEGVTLSNIGGVYGSRGQYDQALESYQQALVIHREMGDGAREEAILANIRVCLMTSRSIAISCSITSLSFSLQFQEYEDPLLELKKEPNGKADFAPI